MHSVHGTVSDRLLKSFAVNLQHTNLYLLDQSLPGRAHLMVVLSASGLFLITMNGDGKQNFFQTYPIATNGAKLTIPLKLR